MKTITLINFLIVLAIIIGCSTKPEPSFSAQQKFVTDDLTNFYKAFDSISVESDTSNYSKIINALSVSYTHLTLPTTPYV